MSDDSKDQTQTLNTKVEDAFISPLTAIRGALEILRDFPDMTDAERDGFLNAALDECARLESGIDHLSASVYATERSGGNTTPTQHNPPAPTQWWEGLSILDGGY